jgi:hypothetical protein
VSFAFNVGDDAFCRSTLVRKANAGDIDGACAELSRWTYAGGKQLPAWSSAARQSANCARRAWHDRRIPHLALAGLGPCPAAGLQTQRLAESSQSKQAAAQAQQAQAATEKKAEAVVEHAPPNRKTPMTTRKKWPAWRLAALLMLPALQACSTTSAAPPPATPSLPVTPLPAEISQISTSDSQPLLAKARAWLASLSDWSNAETPRSTP